jgi:hypothetical protein
MRVSAAKRISNGVGQFSNGHIGIMVGTGRRETMPEIGGEGIEEVADRFAQLSERQAANARTLLEEIERRRREAREQGRNFSAPTGAQLLDRLEGRA